MNLLCELDLVRIPSKGNRSFRPMTHSPEDVSPDLRVDSPEKKVDSPEPRVDSPGLRVDSPGLIKSRLIKYVLLD